MHLSVEKKCVLRREMYAYARTTQPVVMFHGSNNDVMPKEVP
jgi:hypothetical protein